MTVKNGTLKDNLRAIARTINQTFTAPVLANLYRLAIAEATRFPELGCTFYESAPQTGEILTAKTLQKHIDTGELAIDDVPLAARQFQELIKANFFPVAVFGIRTDFTQAGINHSTESVVQM